MPLLALQLYMDTALLDAGEAAMETIKQFQFAVECLQQPADGCRHQACVLVSLPVTSLLTCISLFSAIICCHLLRCEYPENWM